ncbi:hypothetical protein A1OE_509 [Candidatus Endolissoclinum faulkneri L2]|uniref:Uncharacterized protein n=1 Tax=Candidatus Endolissoclinum faulkneri L2 TaxID=1193729 RepID=K7YMF3_9PROT|nr:hypothetical protein A1OE_509 [Candidatus Endolissoclinum faulkneri L2]
MIIVVLVQHISNLKFVYMTLAYYNIKQSKKNISILIGLFFLSISLVKYYLNCFN